MKPNILYVCNRKLLCSLGSGCAANGGYCNYTTHEAYRLYKDGSPKRFEYISGELRGYIKELEEDAT